MAGESNFVDYVKIYLRSGKGGRGSAHFRREKYIPKGGPDGGDGGRGGSIYIEANQNYWTLLHLRYNRHIIAESGEAGGAKLQTGADAPDIVIEVPCGTSVHDATTGEFILDVSQHGERHLLLPGGRGGKGNNFFKTSTNQAPRYAQPGESSQERLVVLQLKTLADVGLVGLPNAGKSTLLNKLTDANILAEDKLFATLDPTTRKLKLGSGQEILVTDTVGFIRKLPHHLIEAFKSTLEEAKYANLLVHMVDASNEEASSQMLVVYDTLRSLDVVDKDIITVFNKTDLIKEGEELPRDFHADKILKMSAKTGEGIEDLKKTIENILQSRRVYLEHIFSYKDAGKIALIRKFGEIKSEEYTDDGILIKAYIPAEIFGKVMG